MQSRSSTGRQGMVAVSGGKMKYYWRIRKWLPERFGQLCRILARGKMNSIIVEFEDGFRVCTSRYFVRKFKAVK